MSIKILHTQTRSMCDIDLGLFVEQACPPGVTYNHGGSLVYRKNETKQNVWMLIEGGDGAWAHDFWFTRPTPQHLGTTPILQARARTHAHARTHTRKEQAVWRNYGLFVEEVCPLVVICSNAIWFLEQLTHSIRWKWSGLTRPRPYQHVFFFKLVIFIPEFRGISPHTIQVVIESFTLSWRLRKRCSRQQCA